MTDGISIHDFNKEVVCSYKDERYSVRDNGAVLRHARVGDKPRPTDNQWTFGKQNDMTGYMEIVSVRVHIIVATAFHGERSTKVYVVDHIDTNRSNNRLENLRWLTRLENVLKNPITRKKIEFVCGCSAEEFLSNPVKYRDKFLEPNFTWMRAVSAEEAKACLENLQAWAKSDKPPAGGAIGEWIYKPTALQYQPIEAISEIIKSNTLNAVQRDWRIASEFPCCPQEITKEPISDYAERLKPGLIFCRNNLYASVVSKSTLSADRQSLYIVAESKGATKPWALAMITFENDLFVHSNLGTFFSLEGVEKEYCLSQGLEWTGGDSFDDYC